MRSATPQRTTIELFAGIGGFRLAAEALGLKTVWANDIEPFAASVYRNAFPSSPFVEGDIHDYLDAVPRHDILTAGFPCQPFSFAGKKAGMSDHRADTFGAIVYVLKHRQPSAFVLENVRSLLTIAHGAHFGDILRRLAATGYSVEWRVRNAMEFGLPQNRQRVILVGWRGDRDREEPLLGTSEEWSRLARKKSLETGVLSDRSVSFPSWGQVTGNSYVAVGEDTKIRKSPVQLQTILQPEVGDQYDFTQSTRHRIGASSLVNLMIDGVEVLWNQEGGRRMGYTVYGTSGAAPTLTCTTSRHYERFKIGNAYRRLTPVEYARLQGFADHHCDGVPHARRYILLGNAVPPPIAKWGLSAALQLIDRTPTRSNPGARQGPESRGSRLPLTGPSGRLPRLRTPASALGPFSTPAMRAQDGPGQRPSRMP